MSGVLASYRDPETDAAQRFASFSGSLADDTIEGTGTTRRADSGDIQTGRWRVTREKP